MLAGTCEIVGDLRAFSFPSPHGADGMWAEHGPKMSYLSFCCLSHSRCSLLLDSVCCFCTSVWSLAAESTYCRRISACVAANSSCIFL